MISFMLILFHNISSTEFGKNNFSESKMNLFLSLANNANLSANYEEKIMKIK